MANHLDLIARFEGYRAEPYWDHKQWSVGYGSYAGGRDPGVKPNITVSQSEARRMLADQVKTYEANVDKYDSRYNWTPNERAAMVSFAYNIGSIDSLTANGTRTKEEIAAKMLEYNKASGRTVQGLVDRRRAEFDVFTGGKPIRDFESGIATSGFEGANVTSAVTDTSSSNAFVGNYNAANNLSDLWFISESSGTFWENELDVYDLYTYNLELFCIDENTNVTFLNSDVDLDEIMTGSWPTKDTKRITIGMTGATTEFNIQDLNVESLGYGSGNNAKMSGTAIKLSFSIVQVGNTSLADSLQNAAVLMGYTSTHDATWYMKIKFLGHSENVPEGETVKATKILPFKISNFYDLQTSTDARGTVTTIEGTIIQQAAFDATVGQIERNMVVPLGATLKETLENYTTILNKTIDKANYTGNTKYVNTYYIEMSSEFEEKYGGSAMESVTSSNLSAAQNVTSIRENGRNVAEQIAQYPPGSNIYNSLQDICVQSTDVKNELTTESPTFSDMFNIIPVVVPKPEGLNVITNTKGHDITYYITIRRTPIVQHQGDQYTKARHTSDMVDEIFTQGRCRKIYYYQYTGLNDQILDLQISLNKQLQKAYVSPDDNYIWANYLNHEGEDISQILQAAGNTTALNAINDSRKIVNDLSGELKNARKHLDSIRIQAESFGRELSAAYADDLKSQGIASGEAEAIAGEAFDGIDHVGSLRNIEESSAVKILNGDRVSTLKELTQKLESARSQVSSIEAGLRREEAKQDAVGMEAVGAILSDRQHEALGQRVSNVVKSLDSNLEGVILIEELDTDFVTRLTNDEFNGLIETMIDNPMVFRRVIMPRLLDRQTPGYWRTSDVEDIELAREKYYEGLDVDISMQNATMTIKGDPFWIDNYITPKKVQELFSDKSTLDQYKNYTTNLNGQNYIMLITNKAAGTDENDNIKVANLMIAVYSIQSVTSSFSGGLFTQTLNMIKMPFPADFKAKNPTITAEFTAIDVEENPELRQFAEAGAFDNVILQGDPFGTGEFPGDGEPGDGGEGGAGGNGTEGEGEDTIGPDADGTGSGPVNPADANDVNGLLSGDATLDSRGSKFSAFGDRTGMAPRSVSTEFEPNTLTTQEAEQARAIQKEMREMLKGKSIMDMSDAEYAKLKRLERSFNEIVDNATTGVRGEVVDELVEQQKRSDLEQSKADLARVQDDVDRFNFNDLIPGNQAEDEALRDELREEVLIKETENRPVILDSVKEVVNPETGEKELKPEYKPAPIEGRPIIIPKPAPPLPQPHIDNGDGTITVEGPSNVTYPEVDSEEVSRILDSSLSLEEQREYIEAIESNNGIKVNQFIESLPEDKKLEVLQLQETRELVKLPGDRVDMSNPAYQNMSESSAKQLDAANSIMVNIENQMASLPRVEKSYTFPDGEVSTWTDPDYIQLQPIPYVDANGNVQTFSPLDYFPSPSNEAEFGYSPNVQAKIMQGLADGFPALDIGGNSPSSEDTDGKSRLEISGYSFIVTDDNEKQEDSEE